MSEELQRQILEAILIAIGVKVMKKYGFETSMGDKVGIRDEAVFGSFLAAAIVGFPLTIAGMVNLYQGLLLLSSPALSLLENVR